MNYYPFHIGDYAAHTGHLDPMEDLAYRRMLDLYYRTEKAMPWDVAQIARLIRLREHIDAIQSVLDEFFELGGDGWHSKRADAELSSMAAKQEQQASKDDHEADRMRRHRERRAEMFAALRAAGIVPAWDTPIKELQRLFDSTCNAPATRTGALPATGLQRLSLPTPTPTPNKQNPPPPSPEGGAFGKFWEEWPKNARKVAQKQCEARWRRQGLDEIAGAVLEALAAAKADDAWRKQGGEFIPAPLTWLKQARWEAPTGTELAAPCRPWQDSRSGIEAKGVEVGIGKWDEAAASVGRGETFLQYSSRVHKRVGNNEKEAA